MCWSIRGKELLDTGQSYAHTNCGPPALVHPRLSSPGRRRTCPRIGPKETLCLCWRNMTSRASGEPWSGPGDLTCHDRGDTDTGTGSATSFPSPHSWRARPCTAAPHLAQRIIPGAPAHVCQPFMMPGARPAVWTPGLGIDHQRQDSSDHQRHDAADSGLMRERKPEMRR